MNREIKFRIWEEHNKCFSKIPHGCMLNNNFNLGVVNDSFDGELRKFIIQQYTGLKDKDNKEIYEGDIIKFTKTFVGKTYNGCDYKNPILGEPKTNISIGEVVFDKINDVDDFYTPTMLAWGIKLKDGRISSLCGMLEEYDSKNLYDSSYWKSISQDWEIVGNIFENSDLIK